MPKLWNATIETHRREVRDAVLDTTAKLVGDHGIRSVTMSRIAEETGIGRATLYKYFPDVEAILVVWHDRRVADHLDRLESLAGHTADARERLENVLRAFALMTYERPHDSEISALVHRAEHIAHAHRHLTDLVRRLLIDGVESGDVRDDVAPDELARYCLHAASAATGLPSNDAVGRLVEVILAGLRPPI